MAYWLMKSEPTTYGINDLANEPKQRDYWDGIRNYQVRNMLRDEFAIGDKALFYHSNCKPPGVVGTMTIISRGYVDDTQFDLQSPYYDSKSTTAKPRWFRVDVELEKIFPHMVTLQQLKDTAALADLPVVQKGSRLSICKLTAAQFKRIVAMGK